MKSTVDRLVENEKEKEEKAKNFLKFMRELDEKGAPKFISDVKGLETQVMGAIKALDIADNVKFCKKANKLMEYLDEREEIVDVGLAKKIRAQVLGSFRIEYAKDTGHFGKVLLDESNDFLRFINALVHVLTAETKGAKEKLEFVEEEEE